MFGSVAEEVLRNAPGAVLITHANEVSGALSLGPFVLHPLVLIYALSGSAMISKTLRIPKP